MNRLRKMTGDEHRARVWFLGILMVLALVASGLALWGQVTAQSAKQSLAEQVNSVCEADPETAQKQGLNCAQAREESEGGQSVLTGPKGDQGPRGPQGPQGVPGTRGNSGDNGTDGVNGSDGRDGSEGTDGASGSDGSDGQDGEVGMPGPAGPPGPQGPQGEAGKDGKDGTNGTNGSDGKQGPPGPSCPSGTELQSREYDPDPFTPGDEETWYVCVVAG